MAIEFITNLASSTLVRLNPIQNNRFDEELIRKTDATRINANGFEKVTEKIGGDSNNTSTFRFQENIPITNALKTIKIFNEPKKPFSVTSDQSKDINEKVESEVDENSNTLNPDKIGNGFYINIGSNSLSNKKSLPPHAEEIIREKLKEVYNLSHKKKNGSLINLTF